MSNITRRKKLKDTTHLLSWDQLV